MQPILFPLAGFNLNLGSSARRGTHPPMLGRLPLPATYLRIFGITKDSTGAVLGSCTVQLFETETERFVETKASDAITGEYEFRSAALSTAYFVVAYKAGAPDVAGTTVNTLLGV